MKHAFPMFRPSVPLPTRGTSQTGTRRSHIMQRAAGKMFHQWAEVIGHRLEEMVNEDRELQSDIASMVWTDDIIFDFDMINVKFGNTFITMNS